MIQRTALTVWNFHSDFDFESDDSDDDAWSPNKSVYSAYKDWLFHLKWDDKILAMLLYDVVYKPV